MAFLLLLSIFGLILVSGCFLEEPKGPDPIYVLIEFRGLKEYKN